jgi:hypothetical protein
MNEETIQKKMTVVYSNVRKFPGRDKDNHEEPNSVWPV